MKKYTTEDLIYFAGLFDGEGSISLHRKSSGTYSIHFTLGNTDKDIIEWIHKVFDGSVGIGTKKGRVMNGGFCASRDCYSWELDAIKLKRLLPDLIPYLRIKKSQAIVMLDYLNKRRTNFTTRSGYPSWYIKWQDEICIKLKELKSSNSFGNLNTVNSCSNTLSDFISGSD